MIGLNHGRHLGAFERHDEVLETEVFHKFHPAQSGFHEGVRGGGAVFRPEVFFERAGVHSNANGGIFFLGEQDDFFEVSFVKKVSWVDADFVGAVVERGNRKARVEVNIGDNWERNAFFNERNGFSGIKVWNGHAHQIAAFVVHGFNFGNHAVHIFCFAHGHGLDGHRMLGADLHLTGRVGAYGAGSSFASWNDH